MQCPVCGYRETKVVDSRASEDGISIRRRRECLNCKKRYTTIEEIELKRLEVRKRDGKKEMYDRRKLNRGVIYACAKRDKSEEDIASLLDGIEQEILANSEDEISSKEIGEIVVRHLKGFDKIAFIRYKSVFNKFSSPDDFSEAIEEINK